MDSWLEGRKVKKEDTIFFTPLKHFGENPDEEEPSEDFSKPRKVHHHRNWKHNQNAENWKNVQSTRSWIFEQTKSNATIVFDPAPVDCIERITNVKRDRILFERILTPRPVPKITLKSCWQASQQPQQQPQLFESSTSGIWKQMRANYEPDRSKHLETDARF